MSESGYSQRTLIVGGTGMLAGVAHTLVQEGDVVTVLARHPERLQGGAFKRLAIDYRDATLLKRSLSAAGSFDRAVVWIHSTAPEAPDLVARVVKPGGAFVHILGSAAAEPLRAGDARRLPFESLGLRYQEVVLGFAFDQAGSRWLTHEEISMGVLNALRHAADRTVIGAVRPWSARPGATSGRHQGEDP